MIHIPLCSGHSLAIKSQISAFEVCAWVENKIPRWLLGLKVTNQSQILPFAFSCPPSSFSFLALFFFFSPFAGHFVGFILVTNNSAKAFRVIGLSGGKYRWFVEQDFHWETLG